MPPQVTPPVLVAKFETAAYAWLLPLPERQKQARLKMEQKPANKITNN